jgi:hypothetical protein
MHWRRTAPVQPVGALLLRGMDCVDRAFTALAGKSDLFRSLSLEFGDDWIVVFASVLEGEGDDEPVKILPTLADATPLHEEAKGWWLPVGIVFGVPDHAQAWLCDALCAEHGFAPPVIIAPYFEAEAETADQADIYLIRQPRPFGDFKL